MQLTRTIARSVHEKEVMGRDERFDRGPTDDDGADMDSAALFAWVVRMVAGGKDSSIVLGGQPVCKKPTIGLCVRSKAAVAQVFRERASDICRSPERLDLRLSKEEAQGHLMGNLVVGELLVEEARRVGKDIDNVCRSEAAQVKEDAKYAKLERWKARQGAADSEAAAAAVAAVDAEVEAACAERYRVTVELKNLPVRRSVIVPMRAPRKPRMSKIIRTPEDHLARLKEEAAAMEAAVPLTVGAHSKAKRARERAQGEQERALKRVHDLSESASDETFAELQSAWLQQAARVKELSQAEGEAEEAAMAARFAAEEAQNEVRVEERVVAMQREAAAEAERMREKQREREEEERTHKMAHLEEVLDILCGTGPPPCVCRPHPADPPYRPAWWQPCGPRCECYRSQRA